MSRGSGSPRGRASERPGHHTSGRLLTAEGLAERWGVRPHYVYRLAREGRVPVVRLGRYRRFRLDEVEEFERAGGEADE